MYRFRYRLRFHENRGGAGVPLPLSLYLPLYLMQCHENSLATGDVSGWLRPIWADVGAHLSWQRPGLMIGVALIPGCTACPEYPAIDPEMELAGMIQKQPSSQATS